MMKKIFKIFILFVIFSIGVIYATPNLPSTPHAFYGNVTNDGTALETGCVICTEVNGITNLNDCITTDQLGKYGYNRKLIAQNVNLEDGNIVKFKIGSTYATQTDEFESGEITFLDLSFTGADCSEEPEGTDPSSGTTGGSDNTSGTTGSSGSTGSTTGTTDDQNTQSPSYTGQDKQGILDTIDLEKDFPQTQNKDDLQINLIEENSYSTNTNSSNFDSILEKIEDSKKQEFNELKNRLNSNNNLRSTINIKEYEIVNPDTGEKSYSTKIELKLQALDNLEEIEYVLVIPKEIAQDVLEIIFNIEPSEVLNADPVVKWNVDSLQKGEILDLSYFVKKEILIQDLDFISISGAKDVDLENTNINTNTTGDSNNNNNSPIDTTTPSNAPFKSRLPYLIGILVVAIIIGIIVDISKKKKKHKGL
ncbi:MAG: hypothetical protein PHN22_03165 [Candidatus ainarchaeum sp.]|nr:hypothetical protein [Candidatus ainarchaeum sp.]